MAALAVLAGIAVAGGSWVLADRLGRDTPPGAVQAPPDRLLLLGCLAAGVLAAIAAFRQADPAGAAVTAALAAPLAATLLTDLRDRLVYPAVLTPGVLVALAAAATGPIDLLPAITAGVVAGGIAGLLVVVARWRWPDSAETPLGGGDIMIAATIGVIFGPGVTATVLFAGMLLAAVVAAALVMSRRSSRAAPIPYGACLCAAALVALAIR